MTILVEMGISSWKPHETININYNTVTVLSETLTQQIMSSLSMAGGWLTDLLGSSVRFSSPVLVHLLKFLFLTAFVPTLKDLLFRQGTVGAMFYQIQKVIPSGYLT